MSSSPIAMPGPPRRIPPATDESPAPGCASNGRRQETVGLFYAIVFVLLVVSLGLLEVAAS
jgi:hypothetical protein